MAAVDISETLVHINQATGYQILEDGWW